MEETNKPTNAEIIGRIYGVYAYATDIFNSWDDGYISVERFTVEPFTRFKHNTEAFERALHHLTINCVAVAKLLRHRLDELFASSAGELPSGNRSEEHMQFWFGFSAERLELRRTFGDLGQSVACVEPSEE